MEPAVPPSFFLDVRVMSACVVGNINCTLCTVHYTTPLPFQNVSTVRQDGQKYLPIPFLIPLNFLLYLGYRSHLYLHPVHTERCLLYTYHRVDRVLGFFTSRPKWDPPIPHPQASVPPFWFEGGTLSHAELRDRGWVGPNSEEGTDTLVL
jgi:hypothetical protein